MNTKICTSLEQSKKLLELGLSRDTADMFWLVVGDSPRLHVLTEPLSNYSHWDNCPAWSLSALLELMPNNMVVSNELGMHKCLCKEYTTDACNTPLEAAYNMVVWLLENNFVTE